MINKNFYRKTNDKKILHKVGKQWKVISVALLLAIGGGAAVAANANADANVSSATQAEVNELETKPNVVSAVSAAPSSAAKSSSASAKPASAISYLSGYNGSAASYHAKVGNEQALYTTNNNIVQAYVNSLNSAFPSETANLTNNYNSAKDQYNNDSSLAGSYSAVAATSGYSSKVASLASKFNATPSQFVQSVGYQASQYNDEVSTNSKNASQMSTVNSYAQLISAIVANPELNNAYQIKSTSAADAKKVADAKLVAARQIFNSAAANSSATASNVNSASIESTSNSAAEAIALINSGIDADTTNSLASYYGYKNDSTAVSSATRSFVSANPVFSGNSNDDVHIYNQSGTTSTGTDVRYYPEASNATDTYDNAMVDGNPVSVSANNSVTANDLYTLFSDTTAMNSYASNSAVYNSIIASGASAEAKNSYLVSSASSAEQQAANEATSASVEARTDSILANVKSSAAPLTAIFGSATSVYTDASSYASNVESAIYSNVKNSNAFGLNTPYNGADSASAFAPIINTIVNSMVSSVSASVASAGVSGFSASSDVQSDTISELSSSAGSISAAFNEATSVMYNEVKALNSAKNSSPADGLNSDVNGLVANASMGSVINSNDITTNQLYSLLTTNSAVSVASNATYFAAGNKLSESGNTLANAGGNAGYATIAGGSLAQSAFNYLFSSVAASNSDTASGTVSYILNHLSNASDGSVAVSNATKVLSQATNGNNSASFTTDAIAKSASAINNILSAGSYAPAISADVSAVSSSDQGHLTSATNALASDADSYMTSYTSAATASSSYEKTYDVNFTLAGSYATSYSADANSDSTVASNAKNSLDTFYTTHAPAKYASASTIAASAGSAAADDEALAHANGMHVFNYGPKFVTITKNAQLHSATDYTSSNVIGKATVGDQFQVVGVGFAANGATRFLVNTKNGNKAYLTGNTTYVEPTYLQAANGVSVTFTKDAKVYTDKAATKATGQTIKAGTTLPNVNIVSLDNAYIGSSRIATPSGNYVTANTKYVSLNGNEANAASGDTDNTAQNNGVVNYWN